MKLIESYAFFYALGRDAKTLKHDIDTEAIAERVVKGEGSVYELCLDAATNEAKPLQNDRKRRAWFEENAEAITQAGGDKDEAYKHFCQGKIDELAGELDVEVTEVLVEDLLESEEDDEEDDCDDEDDKEGE